MNILIVADYILPCIDAGDGHAAVTDVKHLKSSGYRVSLVSTISSRTKQLFQEREDYILHGVPICCIALNDINNIHIVDQPDMVLFHQVSCFRVSQTIARKYQVPLVYRLHIDYQQLRILAKQINVPLTRIITRDVPSKILALEKALFKEVDAVIMPSHYSREHRPSIHRVYVVPPYSLLNLDNYSNKCGSHNEVRILIGGRLTDPMKGFDRVYSVLERINESIPNISVRIAGSIEQHHLSNLNNILGQAIQPLGWLNNLEDLANTMKWADVFLSLSHYEPSGLMLADAISLGAMPICTRVGLAYDMFGSELAQNFLPNDASIEVIAEAVARQLHNIANRKIIRDTVSCYAYNALLEYRSRNMSISQCVKAIAAEIS